MRSVISAFAGVSYQRHTLAALPPRYTLVRRLDLELKKTFEPPVSMEQEAARVRRDKFQGSRYRAKAAAPGSA